MADNYIARKDGSWLVVSLLPDVCKTPVGASTPPVPYPVVAYLASAGKIEPTVRANKKPLLLYDKSFIPTTIGDAAGSATGIKSGTVGGKCYPKEHSGSVRAGGKPILRHGDEFWMNGA